MTPEEELDLLIREQKADDEAWTVSRPENVVSLDAQTPSGEACIGDLIGVDDLGERFCFLPHSVSPLTPSNFAHGYGGYTKHGCRCRQCKDGNAAYRRARRSRGQA